MGHLDRDQESHALMDISVAFARDLNFVHVMLLCVARGQFCYSTRRLRPESAASQIWGMLVGPLIYSLLVCALCGLGSLIQYSLQKNTWQPSLWPSTTKSRVVMHLPWSKGIDIMFLRFCERTPRHRWSTPQANTAQRQIKHSIGRKLVSEMSKRVSKYENFRSRRYAHFY